MSNEETPKDGALEAADSEAAKVVEALKAEVAGAHSVSSTAGDAAPAAPAATVGEDATEILDAVNAAADKIAEATGDTAAKAENAKESVEEEAAKALDALNEESKKDEKKSEGVKLGTGAWVGIAVAALVVGLLIGGFALNLGGGGASGSLGGKTALTEAELDSPVASYTYDGATNQVTAREVILQNSSLDAAKDTDGNYTLPSADSVLSVARNSVVLAEAEKRGLSATDDDISAYAQETLGSSDYASIASSYSMDEESVKDLLRSSCMMSKLRDEVVGTDSDAVAPEAPTAPEDEKDADKETKAYAEYIIALAGDEWDAEKGDWASTDGPYATALAEYKVGKKASYNAANAAYQVAYQAYSEAASATSTQWSDFVNGLLSNASIDIYSLVS